MYFFLYTAWVRPMNQALKRYYKSNKKNTQTVLLTARLVKLKPDGKETCLLDIKMKIS